MIGRSSMKSLLVLSLLVVVVSVSATTKDNARNRPNRRLRRTTSHTGSRRAATTFMHIDGLEEADATAAVAEEQKQKTKSILEEQQQQQKINDNAAAAAAAATTATAADLEAAAWEEEQAGIYVDVDIEVDRLLQTSNSMSMRSLLLPTVTINQIVLETETFIYCTSENNDDGTTCASTACNTTNVKSYPIVSGYLLSASGQFSVSYGNNGFFINDGTGGIFVNVAEDSLVTNLPVGTHVNVYDASGTCLSGTKQLENGVIEVLDEEDVASLLLPGVVPVPSATILFPPSQIGQFEKLPTIPNYNNTQHVMLNTCDCLDPTSYTQGQLITVQGIMIGTVFDDSPWGWKVFLDGDEGSGPAQVFIDGASDAYVTTDYIETMLVTGNVLCVTGLVAQFAGVGWELLPRTAADIVLC